MPLQFKTCPNLANLAVDLFDYSFKSNTYLLYRPIEGGAENRSSRPEVFCKKGVLRNFTKFKGKHLCQSLFFNKVAGLRPATLLKKRLWHRCFPVNFAKFLRTSFLTEHLRWLLLRKVLLSLVPTAAISSIAQLRRR